MPKIKIPYVFRNVFANLCIVAIVLSILVYTLVDASVVSSATVSPIYRGESEKEVSLMINVYWGEEYIDDMLSALEKKQAKTTFFLGGSWIKKNEKTVWEILEQGHEIANHGFFHKDHKKINRNGNREEILSTHNLVKSIYSKEMELFMPPSGSFSAVTLEIARDLGYTTIMWSKDTIDWRDQDSELIFKRATKNISGGDLILMHPTECTAKALPKIIDEIYNKGFTISPVSKVIGQMGEV